MTSIGNPEISPLVRCRLRYKRQITPTEQRKNQQKFVSHFISIKENGLGRCTIAYFDQIKLQAMIVNIGIGKTKRCIDKSAEKL